MAAPKKYGNCPMPSFFNPEGAKAFHELELEDDDIIMNSFVKAGTTWVNKIIHSLVRLDENGNPQEGLNAQADIGKSGQVYPDWLPLKKPDDPEWEGVGPGGMMGKWCFEDLLKQPKPRLFSTHVTAELLPQSLSKRGRMIYVLRNPKDCLNSLHYFRGEAKDGWLGNEHGPGSLARFLSGVNAYGSFFDHARDMQTYIDENCPKRALVVYYEDLKSDSIAGIQRIAEFLGIPLSEKKLETVFNLTTFDAMSGGSVGKMSAILCRKGVAGDWVNAPLTEEHWAMVEKEFEDKLGKVKLAQPLRQWMSLAHTELIAPETEHKGNSSAVPCCCSRTKDE